MKILITGNPKEGLAQALSKEFPEAAFVSRENGYHLNLEKDRERLAHEALDFDVFINNSPLSKFHQSLLLEKVFQLAHSSKKNLHILNIGSSVDRSESPSNLYAYEKRNLRKMSNSLSQMSNYQKGPRVSLISFGNLSTLQEKFPDQKSIPIETAAKYIRWVLEIPASLLVNEICLEPWQG